MTRTSKLLLPAIVLASFGSTFSSSAAAAQTVNALGLLGDLGTAFAQDAGVYRATVEKVEPQNTARSGAISGVVTLRVDATLMGRETKSLLLPFSTPPLHPLKDSGAAVWKQQPQLNTQMIVVVVPNGTDGNIRPLMADGAASEAWEIKGDDDPALKEIKGAVDLWNAKEIDSQLKQAASALAGTDKLMRSLAASVLADKTLAKKSKETLVALDEELALVKADKAKLEFKECITLFAAIESLSNSPKVEPDIKDSALRTLAGFVLVPDSQVSTWALGYLATAVGRGNAKASASQLLTQENVASLQAIIKNDLKTGADVMARAAAEKVASWAGVLVGQ